MENATCSAIYGPNRSERPERGYLTKKPRLPLWLQIASRWTFFWSSFAHMLPVPLSHNCHQLGVVEPVLELSSLLHSWSTPSARRLISNSILDLKSKFSSLLPSYTHFREF